MVADPVPDDPVRSAARGDTRQGLPLTGERTLPGIPDERYWFVRHVVAYRAARAWLDEVADDAATTGGPTVLDAGCGEGYGLAILRALGAARVVGIDLDGATIAHAEATYAAPDPGIEVAQAELRAIPLPDAAVDLTLSLQVIEHLHDIPGYLRELQRVTRAGGLVAISTPNRLTFSPGRRHPTNPFHTVEFTATELNGLLTRAGLEVFARLGSHHAGRIAEVEAARGTSIPDLLTELDPSRWPDWLRTLVHSTEETDFVLTSDHLDTSLDLLLACRVRP
ncbi:MAG: class I SAM-dependent methyltransferase [Nitriliruptoraceae bacterium]